MPFLRYSGPSPFYRELAELPVPTSAQFVDPSPTPSGVSVVRVSYSIRDHERNVKQSITKTFTLATAAITDAPVISSSISPDSSEILAVLFAPSGKRHALLKEVSDANGTKKRYVEVWSGTRLDVSLEVTKRHGPFHTDDYFRSSSFSPSETALVYTAEANPETTESLQDDPYPKFRYVPHFGEQLYSRKRPALFVFRWGSSNESQSDNDGALTASVTALSLDHLPDIPVVFGQAVFATETRLYATGYEQTGDGRLLGVKGCFNRSASIWELVLRSDNSESATTTIVSEAVKVETPGRQSRSPRVLLNKDRVPTTLFWLSNPVGGAHASTVTLHTLNLTSGSKPEILVDAVDDPSADAFPGLHTDYSLADSPFLRLGDKVYVLVQSLWHARPTLILVDAESGAITDLTPVPDGRTLYSWNLLATDGAQSVIGSRSTPTSPPETVLLTLTSDSASAKVRVLDRPAVSPKLQKAVDRLEASVIPVPDRYPVETIVIRSKTSEQPKPVCLTIPHGGPHAANVTSFTPGVLAYVLEGYTVSLPNYTGSTGYGEKYVQKLIGRCGTLDVADCLATVDTLNELGVSQPGRHIVQGGSHGGFLAAHLVGQHPGVFRAAVLRNPVISAGELCTSDIPDWAPREFGHEFKSGTYITPETFAALYAASPIAHVARVTAPVLILLGEDDLRVPPTQGRGYYHALKGRRGQTVVELLVFPKESHPTDGVEAARVSFEAGRDWFQEFAQEK